MKAYRVLNFSPLRLGDMIIPFNQLITMFNAEHTHVSFINANTGAPFLDSMPISDLEQEDGTPHDYDSLLALMDEVTRTA